MKYLLELDQEKEYGQIPVVSPNGKIKYIIMGNLNNPNHTLYLHTTSNQEIGRLYRENGGLIASFTIDVIDHSLVKVKKINSPLTNLFYLTRLNYLITGNIKHGSYSFKSGIKTVASIKTVISKAGVVLNCKIERPEDVPFILLTVTLLTQWHTKPLKLPVFPPINNKYNIKFN